MIEVDVRGLSCPIPVVKTRKAFERDSKSEVVVLIDSEVSVENVSRLARNRGYSVTVEREGGEYRLILRPQAS